MALCPPSSKRVSEQGCRGVRGEREGGQPRKQAEYTSFLVSLSVRFGLCKRHVLFYVRILIHSFFVFVVCLGLDALVPDLIVQAKKGIEFANK